MNERSNQNRRKTGACLQRRAVENGLRSARAEWRGCNVAVFPFFACLLSHFSHWPGTPGIQRGSQWNGETARYIERNLPLEQHLAHGESLVVLVAEVLGCIDVDAMFRHTSKGYRDWRLFANASTFSIAVGDYVHPQAASIFAGTNLDFGRWVLSHIADDGNKGWEEKIG